VTLSDEMNLKQFIESVWFKGLSRLAMLVGVPALSFTSVFVGYVLNDVRADQVLLRTEVAEQDRATSGIRDDIASVKTQITNVGSSVSSLQLDVAKITGILQEMQRREMASNPLAPFSLTALKARP
jgi:septal ring factor EnvC (AmiA/AmiB activator)